MMLPPPRKRSSGTKKRKICEDDGGSSTEARAKCNAAPKCLSDLGVKEEPYAGTSARQFTTSTTASDVTSFASDRMTTSPDLFDEIVVASATSKRPESETKDRAPVAEVHRLEAECITLRIAQDEMKEEVEQLEQERDAARSREVAAHKKHTAELEDLSSGHSRQVAALRACKADEVIRAREIVEELDRVQEANTDLLGELHAAKAANELNVEHLTTELETSSRLRQHLDNQLQEARSENENMKSDIAAAQAANELRLNQLTADADQQSRLQQDLQRQLRESRAEAQDMKRKFEDARAANELKVQGLTAELNKRSTLCRDLQRRVQDGREGHDNQNNVDQVKELQADLCRERNARERAVRDCEATRNEKAQEYDNLLKERYGLMGQLAEARLRPFGSTYQQALPQHWYLPAQPHIIPGHHLHHAGMPTPQQMQPTELQPVRTAATERLISQRQQHEKEQRVPPGYVVSHVSHQAYSRGPLVGQPRRTQ